MHSAQLFIGRGKNRVPNALYDSLNRIVCSFPDAGTGQDTRRGSPSTAETIDANARLIAAAPELLHACKWALDSMLAVDKLTKDTAVKTKLASPVYHLRAAIHKATTP